MNDEDSYTTGLGKIENILQFIIFAFNLWENVIAFSVYNANNVDSTYSLECPKNMLLNWYGI